MWSGGKPRRPSLSPELKRALVEKKIQEAMDRGEFDNLPGAGKPVHIEPPPVRNEDLWWALKILKQANFVPDEVRWRKRIDELRDRMYSVADEQQLRQIVRELNELIVRLNTMGTNRIPTTLSPFDEEEVVAEFRARGGPNRSG